MADLPSSGRLTALLKLLVFTLLVPCSVTVWLPYSFYGRRLDWGAAQSGGRAVGGMLCVLLGAMGYLWCGLDFAFAGRGTPAPIDPPKILVARGLYRFVRNPMYISVLLVLLGESLVFQSADLFRYAGVVGVGFFFFVLLYEEPALRSKFGPSYRQYCEEVPRWIPRMPRKN